MGGARRCLAVAPAPSPWRGERWSHRRCPSMTAIALLHARLPRIAVLGAGHVGPVIARGAIEAGQPGAVRGSGGPEGSEPIRKVPGPGAQPPRAPRAARGPEPLVAACPRPQ